MILVMVVVLPAVRFLTCYSTYLAICRKTLYKHCQGSSFWKLGGGKKPLGMSELGCADGCGQRGRTAARVVAGSGWGEEAAGDQQAWFRGRLRTAWVKGVGGEKKPLGMSELGCADGCRRRGCKGVAGNGWNEWGEEAAGDERAWLHGRLRTAWVQGSGWKWVGRKGMENGCLSAGYVCI